MSNTTAAHLARLIQNLQHERQQHAGAIAEIDGVFSALGITATPPTKRGRKPGSTTKAAPVPTKAPATVPTERKRTGKKGRRTKAKDGLTGGEYLMRLLVDEKLSTAEINKRWKSSGRGGTADNTLGALVRDNKLKRTNIKGGRGSEYAAK